MNPIQPGNEKIFFKALKYLAALLASLIILLAVTLSILRQSTPLLNQQLPALERWATEFLHHPAKINRFTVSWHGLSPGIACQGVKLYSDDKQHVLMAIQHMSLHIDLWHSLTSLSVIPSKLNVDGAKLNLWQNQQGHFSLAGMQDFDAASNKQGQALSFQRVMMFLFAEKSVNLNDITILWHRPNKLVIPIENLSATLSNKAAQHRLTAQAQLRARKLSTLKLNTELNGSADDISSLQGKLYLSIDDLGLDDWLKAYAWQDWHITSGLANIKLWLDVNNGQVTNAQSQVSLQRLQLNHAKQMVYQVNQLSGNLAWQTQADGFSILANHLNTVINHKSLLIHNISYQQKNKDQAQQSLRFDRINLQTLSQLISNFPMLNSEQQKYIINLRIAGQLKNFKLQHLGTWQTLSDLKQISSTGEVVNAAFKYAPISSSGAPAEDPVKLAKSSGLSAFVDNDDRESANNGELVSKKGLPTKNKKIRIIQSRKAISISGLNFRYQIQQQDKNQRHGRILINSDELNFSDQAIFSKTLPLGHVQADIAWQQNAKALSISGSKMSIDDPLLLLDADMALNFTDFKQAPMLELKAQTQIRQTHALMQYVPDKIMSVNLTRWLQKAIVSSKRTTGNIIFHGKLNDFPFDNKQGKFEADAHLQGASLAYEDKWPALTDLDATLNFTGRDLRIAAKHGKISGATLTSAKADILHMGRKGQPVWLHLQGNCQGDMQQALSFLRQSPLKHFLGKDGLPGLSLSGPMQTKLGLSIPMHKSTEPLRLSGVLSTEDSQLNYQFGKINLKINHLKGQVSYSDSGINADNLEGLLFNEPANIKLYTKQEGKHRDFYIKSQGTFTPKAVSKVFEFPLLANMSGRSHYHMQLHIQGDPNKDNRIDIHSKLQGIKVDLPTPLGKTAESARDINIHSVFGRKDNMQLFLNYAGQVTSALGFKRVNNTWQLNRGEVLLGKGKVNVPKQVGLIVKGHISKLLWPEWQPLFELEPLGKKTANKQSSFSASLLNNAEFQVDDLNAFGRYLGSSDIKVFPTATGGVRLSIKGERIQGQIIIPKDRKKTPIVANLDRLYLPKNPENKSYASTLHSNDITALDFNCADFYYEGKPFGKVNLQLRPVAEGLAVKQLKVAADWLTLQANGTWLNKAKHNAVAINGSADILDIDKATKIWHLPHSLQESNVQLDYKLNWQTKDAFAPDLSSLFGHVNIQLGRGHIVGLSNETNEKLGLGRLINILSLQTLPRRLTLDFSDFDKGFAFDSVKAHFTLTDGNAYTDDLSMDGPVAYITLRGRIGLAAQDYDLKLRVVPYITSSLPVVAAIAGGPVAGVVTWAANKIFTTQRKRSQGSGSEYSITGPWAKPDYKELKTN